MTVGWAIIGIGKLSDVAIAPAIDRQPDSELVAVCSRSLERATSFAQRHGDPLPFTDYDAMLSDDRVDVVYIATPNALHVDHMVAAAAAGKHVLVDKPMALSVDDGQRMIAAAEAHGIEFAVGFQLRHKRTNRAARDAIAQGRIGPPSLYEMSVGAGKDHFPYDTWRSDPRLAGGGTVLNQGTHVIDLVQFLAGSPIVEVTCFTDSSSNSGAAATAALGPAEEVAVISCRLANGALASLSSNQVIGGTPRNWLAVASNGWLEGKGALAAPPGDEVVLHTAAAADVVATGTTNAYDEEVAAFARAVMGFAPVNGTGDDGLRTIAVADALYRSAAEGRAVAVL
ncbi:MAG: Gfo/Idh/MocA family oxidoreductase [Actinomycetota bacterium]|nr:Gfo/Idh/MocA family oxidoreductase [Actinomycetota bacterium]